ncbi:MAG: hypothetical protein ABI729_04225 [Chitinophagales bacterium]
MTSTQSTTAEWTFAREEGRAVIVADFAYSTIDVYTGPDCDGHSTHREITFARTDGTPEQEVGTWTRATQGVTRGVEVWFVPDTDTAVEDAFLARLSNEIGEAALYAAQIGF